MDWIKRNILFVVGSTVAVVLMGLAAFYLVSGMHENEKALEKLNAEYSELDRLSKQKPHPGDEKTDNIKAARKQAAEVRAFVRKAAEVFEPIAPIPSGTNLNNAMFAGALRRTIDRLEEGATKAGVQVPTNFYFSFTAVRDRIMFDKAGLGPLATQLGEVTAICSILIDARVNALDAVRREKVSVHDQEAQQTTDYLLKTTVTNDVAITSPYEVTIRCFSGELANVLAGFGSSPHGLIVRGINVEPAGLGGAGGLDPYGESGMGGFAPFMSTGEGIPPTTYAPQPLPAYTPAYEGGISPGNPYGEGGPYGGNRYQQGNRYLSGDGGGEYNPGAAYPPAVLPSYPAPGTVFVQPRAPSAGRGGLPTMLDEKQLKVTMLVEVTKLIPR